MTFEELSASWEVDGRINQADVSDTARKLPNLHNKYYMMYVPAVLKLKKYKAELRVLHKLKGQWYRGELAEDELKHLEWAPQPLKILRQDIPDFIEGDADVIKLGLKIDHQEVFVNYLESIIRQIQNLNFTLKTIVDFERFKAGS